MEYILAFAGTERVENVGTQQSYVRNTSSSFDFIADEALHRQNLNEERLYDQNIVRGAHFFIKRLMDIVVSLTAILILLPFFLAVAFMIRMDSKGPALFTQIRWGKGGKKIRIYKFRSMRTDLCDHSGVQQTIVGDPRVTRIGSIIRRTNIDELPQLFNVLKGDMSLVGPRCHAIGMLAAGMPYEALVPEYHKRHAMRPGITGLAQMRGLRGPTDRPGKARARIACDLHYIENFSIWLDIRIIFGTVMSELVGGKGF